MHPDQTPSQAMLLDNSIVKLDRYHQKDLVEGKQNKGIDPRHDTSEALPGYRAQMQLVSAIITMAFNFFKDRTVPPSGI
jgi:hypothetical protein